MRKPIVSRTIRTTKATLLCASVSKRETFEQVVTVPRTYEKEADLLKAVNAVVTDPDTKVCAVLNTVVEETLYGMSEADFIANSKPITRGKSTADTDASADSMAEDGETPSAN